MRFNVRYGSLTDIGVEISDVALRPEADIRRRIEHVCFVPLTDIQSVDLLMARSGSTEGMIAIY